MRVGEKLEIEELDLVGITGDDSKTRCGVSASVDFRWHTWLRLGTASLLAPGNEHRLPWRLEARVADGTTDFEHSTCFVVRLPLVGVAYEFTSNGGSCFHGWVAPDEDDFRVAPPDWNPGRRPGASSCDRCRGREKHRMCPQGEWMPPRTPKLFEQMRMRAVQIWFGPSR